MRSRGIAVFVVSAGVAVIGLLLVGARDERELAFTLGVRPGLVAAALAPGDSVCQAPVNVSAEFTSVRFQMGTNSFGSRMEVSVRSMRSGQQLAHGSLSGGNPRVAQQGVSVGEVRDSQRVEVCLQNAGKRTVTLYGNSAEAAAGTDARMGGHVLAADLTLIFLRDEPRSLLSLVPAVFERASVFRPSWVGPWTFWILSAFLFAGVPFLLALALARALPEDVPAPIGSDEGGSARSGRSERPRAGAGAR
jgi:hypothetical protein